MKNKKEFIGVTLSVLVSVFLVGLGTYATTVVSTNIVTGGTVEGNNIETNNAYNNVFVGQNNHGKTNKYFVSDGKRVELFHRLSPFVRI